MRNASGGLPPISRPADSDLTSNGISSTSAVGGSSDAAVTEPVKPVKPINRPATSKNAIVYNAVQVSYTYSILSVHPMWLGRELMNSAGIRFYSVSRMWALK